MQRYHNTTALPVGQAAVPAGVDWALWAAGHGFAVFPVQPGNPRPYANDDIAAALGIDPGGPGGFHHASTDETAIRAMWSGDRADARIGIRPAAGLMVIDLDEKNGKSGSATLRANGWSVPETATQRTPSGGWHYFVTVPPGTIAPTDSDQAGNGVDRRGPGGYAVLYDPAFLTTPIAPAPEWSLSKARTASEGLKHNPLGTGRPAPSLGFLQWLLDASPPNEMGHDDWRAMYWATMQSGWTLDGSEDHAVLRSMLDNWCARYTFKANDPRRNETLWKDALKGGTACGWATLERLTDREVMVNLLGHHYFSRSQPTPPAAPLPMPAPTAANDLGGARVLTSSNLFVPWGDLQPGPPEYLVHGLLETDTVADIFSPPKHGKSFVATDFACCVATGADFHGHAVKQGAVFYIAGEGHRGLVNRRAAWEGHRGRSTQGWPLFLSQRSVQFLNQDSAAMVREAVEKLAQRHGAPRLIVIDTLNRNFGPGDENSQADMTRFIAEMDDLRVRFDGCTVLIVHHSGHGDKDRARGSSVLPASVDAAYRVEKKGDRITLFNMAMKDAPAPPAMTFEMIPVGHSVALEQVDDDEQPSSGLTAREREALNVLASVAVDGLASDDDWRAAFYATLPDEMKDKRKPFGRATENLVALGYVVAVDDDRWQVQPMPGMVTR